MVSLPLKYIGEYGGGYHTESHPAGGKEQVEKALDLIVRQKWVILLSFIVVVAVSIAYTMTRVPEYQASSFVIVDLGKVTVDIGRRPLSTAERPDAGFDLFARNDRSLSGEIRLLQISDQLAQRVNQRLHEERSEALPGNTGTPFTLNGYVQFEPERGSDNIIRFRGISSDATQAALLANLYAEEYVGLTQEASRSHALALQESLQEKEKEQREELTRIEEQVKRAMERGGVGLDQGAAHLVGQIASLEVQRDQTNIDLQVERATLASLERELAVVNPQLVQRISSGVERRLQALQDQLDKEEATRAKILLENPDLREGSSVLQDFDQRIERLRAQIDSLSAQYVREMTAAGGMSGSVDGVAYVASLRQQVIEKRSRINRLEAARDILNSRLGSYQASMANLPEQTMELAQLERSRLLAEQMYQNVVTQLQEARIAEEAEPGYAQLIRTAQVPGMSVYPDPWRNLILGAFFGLLLGFMLAIVRDKLDNRIYQTEQLRKKGLKEIGVIPNMKSLIKEDFKGKAFLEHDGKRFSTSLVTLFSPVSAPSEAYRCVRTNIQFSLPGTHVQTLLITSPGVAEGKSTTAANLAIMMAQAGRSTLLIDADLRRPRQHQLFGLQRKSGLIELLTNGSHFDSSSWRTYIENLSILPAGSPILHKKDGAKPSEGSTPDLEEKEFFIANSAELLGSTQMYEFLEAMRETFDIIIIDTPPVLAATDAALLSTQCDATIVVARASVSKEDEISFAVESLEDVGATVIGILLNGFDVNMAYGYKYKYRNYTRYGRYSKHGYYGYRSSK